LARYHLLQAEAPEETTMLQSEFELLIQDWLSKLSKTTYPKLRRELFHRRQK
jgi:hypothetical protein